MSNLAHGVKRTRLNASLRSVHNWRQLAKFCVVGGFGALVNILVFRTLVRHGVHYLAAGTCSFLVAVTSNYTWNRVWTFRAQRGHVGAQGARFFVVSLAALGANLLLLELLIGVGGINQVLGQAIAIVLVTPLNFIGNKLWSFRRHKK